MKITFGIITSQPYASYVPNYILTAVFNSISNEQIDDDVEVLVVGGDKSWAHEEYRFIAFDESQRKAWITRKKNIITAEAKYDNIVYMHDYVTLNPGWYAGFLKFGEDFQVCMTPIFNADGNRFRDWTLWAHDITPDGSPNLNALLPYDVLDLSRFMYFSGAYWIAKKSVMKEFPLDETLGWGEGEDVKWSKQIRQKYPFKLNPHSSVRLLKLKDRVVSEATPELIQELRGKNEILQSQ